MGTVKNHYHDEFQRWNALENGESVCAGCSDAFAEQDGLCPDCWSEINGQFGVGA